MIIKKLILHNFGIYARTNTFTFKEDKPIVLIGGMNGRGKTTFLAAILLALYGSNSFAYTESKYKSFSQYLKAYVNVTDGTMRTYLELEFTLDTDKNELYRIRREWIGNKLRAKDKISVHKNGEYNAFLTDNWAMFIENILPNGLSNFFFFDGEKIAELAVEETSTQMKESIKNLLGINVIDTLQNDIKRVLTRTMQNEVSSSMSKEVEVMRFAKEEAEQKLFTIDYEIKELEEKIEKAKAKLEKYTKKYEMKGGLIVNQKQNLINEKSAISSKIDLIKEQLIQDAASELPLLLVRHLLWNIRESSEIVQERKTLNLALKHIMKMTDKYKCEFKEESTEDLYKFLKYVKENTKTEDTIGPHNLSDTALTKLQVLLDDQLSNKKYSVKEKRDELIKVKQDVGYLESYLDVDIDEKSLANIYKSMKEKEQEIIVLQVQFEGKKEERKGYNGSLMKATSEFNKYVEKYLKKVELNDDNERMIKYAHIADTVLQEYRIRLQKEKVENVAKTMTECYKQLASKQNLVESITMDPINLDMLYLDKNSIVIEKASLSAGEKQLMVISLLWALALCSRRKLPVIIDTPLSRLDSVHRTTLINKYFPNASEQTIILSTDSEIDFHYYEMMKDDVGDEFTLVYDDMSKSTTIHRGYFMEAENDN